jgi:hypothetical protein
MLLLRFTDGIVLLLDGLLPIRGLAVAVSSIYDNPHDEGDDRHDDEGDNLEFFAHNYVYWLMMLMLLTIRP